MSRILWEYGLIERPICEQLRAIGWRWMGSDADVPGFTERDKLREVLLSGRFTVCVPSDSILCRND